MAHRETRFVIVKATGRETEVYKTMTGAWCDFADCKTIFQESELEFKK